MEKKIILKELELYYFKGIKKFNEKFSQETSFEGANATGKTTLFDAFCWLLFGKDSSDKKDFSVKTLDEENNEIPKIDHYVRAVILVNDEEVVLKRTLKEDWRKPRGQAEVEFKGNKTEFEYNDVPMKSADFVKKIAEILDEKTFKLLTNPLYFNNELHWTERRKILISIAGEVNSDDVLKNCSEDSVDFLKTILNSSKTLEEYKKEFAAKRKLLKDSLKEIPTRIDEAERSKPVLVDEEAINQKISEINLEIFSIEKQIENRVDAKSEKFKEVEILQKELSDLKVKLIQLKSENKIQTSNVVSSSSNELSQQKEKRKTFDYSIKNTTEMLESAEDNLKQLNTKKENLISEWKAENSKTLTLDKSKSDCGICGKSYKEITGEDPNEVFLKKFNENQAQSKKEIEEKGEAVNEKINNQTIEIQKFNQDLKNLNEKRNEIDVKIDELTIKVKSEEKEKSSEPEDTIEIKELQEKIKSFEIPEVKPVDTTELKEKKKVLQEERDILKSKLSINKQINQIDVRIEELKSEEKEKSSELASLEKKEFALETYNKERITSIEDKINDLFVNVKFKMFKQQINGGEEEVCQCLVGGVPFQDVNSAGQINAGIDVINTLSKHYGTNAPIWIDNRESVVTLEETKSQIINLIVKPNSKLSLKK